MLEFSLYVLLYFILYLLICIFLLASEHRRLEMVHIINMINVPEAVKIMTEP